MRGWLSSDHAPYIAPVMVEAGGEHQIVIDTGFNGSLYVPEDSIETWNLPFLSSVEIALADQSTVVVEVFEATVAWFGDSVRVQVLAGPPGCESLLGMEPLEGCRIELDQLIGEVRVEQL